METRTLMYWEDPQGSYFWKGEFPCLLRVVSFHETEHP